MMKRKSALKVTVFFAMLLCLLFSAIGVRTEQVVQAAETEEARELNYVKKNLEVSKTFTLKVDNLKAGDTVKYSSSNKKILTVSSKGVCKGVAPGTVTVTATVTAKDKTKVKLTCKVTVKEMRIPTISDLTLQKDGDFIIGSSSATITFSVDKTTTATISVCDSFNDVIYEKTVNVTKNKPAKFTWKGKDSNGDPAEVDLYYFRVDCDKAEAKTDFFDVTDVCDFSGGNGSAKKPYQITTAEEFKKMVAHNGCNFILNADIDVDYNALFGLFTEDAPFNGTLDGKGHTISNMNNQGPIFVAVGAEGQIKNLNIEGLITTDSTSALVGKNYGNIEKVTISNMSLTGGSWSTGTILDNYGTIKNCSFSGSIGSTAYNRTWGNGGSIGGVAYANAGTGKIIKCTTSVTLSVNGTGSDASGLITAFNTGAILYSTSSGELIKGSSNSFGAIAGSNSGTVSGCSYTGTATNLKLCGSGIGTVN